jgi:allantoate deiminase
LQERLDRIYAIGDGPGANRPGYTTAEDAAHRLVAGWMREAGLVVTRDAAGNLFGRLPGRQRQASEVWTGSHLDSVPRGGRFDGALGVIAGLEAVARVGAQERTLCVVVFRDEEGWRFGRGCTGSRALTGTLEPGELDSADAEGVLLREAIGALPARAWLEPPLAFVEAHPEQGTVLDSLDAPLGVVSAIVGLARLAVTFAGEAGHAGTTPMTGRADALVAASAFVLAVREIASSLPGAVATVGQLSVAPGAANVIPARVDLVVDARAADEASNATLLETIVQHAHAAGATVETLRRTAPVEMDGEVTALLERSLRGIGLTAPTLASRAGHDAGVLRAAGVPTAMLFVRSRHDGASHSPDEHCDDADVSLCVDALSGALERLAGAR